MCKSTTEGGKRCEGHLRSDYMAAMDPMDTKIGTMPQYMRLKAKVEAYATHPKGLEAIQRDMLRYEALCLECDEAFPEDYSHYSYVVSILRGVLRATSRTSAVNQDIANIVKMETEKNAISIDNVYSLQDYRDRKAEHQE
jgi:hypothetical protein